MAQAFDYKRGYNYALYLLGRQSYSKKALGDKLRSKGVNEADAQHIVDKLLDYQLLDDERYAEQLVHSRKSTRGVRALRQDLYAKGIDEQIIDKTLSLLSQDEQLLAAAKQLEKIRWRLLKTDEGLGAKARAKAFTHLTRKGFALDTIEASLAQFFGDVED